MVPVSQPQAPISPFAPTHEASWYGSKYSLLDLISLATILAIILYVFRSHIPFRFIQDRLAENQSKMEILKTKLNSALDCLHLGLPPEQKNQIFSQSAPLLRQLLPIMSRNSTFDFQFFQKLGTQGSTRPLLLYVLFTDAELEAFQPHHASLSKVGQFTTLHGTNCFKFHLPINYTV